MCCIFATALRINRKNCHGAKKMGRSTLKMNHQQRCTRTLPDTKLGYLVLAQSLFYQDHTILACFKELVIRLSCIGYTYKSITKWVSTIVPKKLAEKLVSLINNLAT